MKRIKKMKMPVIKIPYVPFGKADWVRALMKDGPTKAKRVDVTS